MYKTTGGYLKIIDKSEAAQIWWDGLNTIDKNIIKSIPNFDAEKFQKCTGIKVDWKENEYGELDYIEEIEKYAEKKLIEEFGN